MEAKPYLKEIVLKKELVPSADVYPFNIPALRDLHVKFHADVTFIVGENGAGKSTLIEAIALCLGFAIEGGTKSGQFKTHDNNSSFFEYLKQVKSFAKPSDYYFLRAESFYNVATYIEELNHPDNGYGVESLHACSHGESFMAMLTNKLRGKGLYIFDEPEAALSPTRQLSALAAIHQLVKKQSQFIIATHSPILLAYPNAVIYQLDQNGMRQIAYEETEHYMVTKQFLDNPSRMMEVLLQE